MNWFHGKLDDHVTFLGIQIFWIARAAKLLEFLSGSVMVLDWIGTKSLASWVSRIDSAVRLRHKRLGDALNWIIARKAGLSVGLVFSIYAAMGLMIGFGYTGAHPREFLVILAGMFASGIATLVGLKLLVRSVGKIVAMLDRAEEDPKRPIVGIACIFLLIGFALDFLTS